MGGKKNLDFRLRRLNAGLSIKQAGQLTGYSTATIYRWEQSKATPRKAALELIENYRAPNSGGNPKCGFSFIDLFAGIGGMRLGFESIGGECVFTSEWNKYCEQTYRANFSTSHDVIGDITKFGEKFIPKHDVLLAGFPCQPFSIAGVSKKNALKQPHGFHCELQGNLFFDIARIIKHHRPQAFLLENVKNLVSHDKGNTFEVIKKTLIEDLGYFLNYQVINSRHWVPQARQRIFIVGFREKNDFSFGNLKQPSDEPKLKAILHPQDGSEPADGRYVLSKKSLVNPKYTLSKHLWGYLQEYALKHKKKGNGFGYGLFGPDDVARTLSARYYKDGSEILIKRPRGIPRRLTPRECSRIMGFDTCRKGVWEEFSIPVSDNQAYRQFGNAVVVPVVKSVAQLMKKYISVQYSDRYEQRLQAVR